MVGVVRGGSDWAPGCRGAHYYVCCWNISTVVVGESQQWHRQLSCVWPPDPWLPRTYHKMRRFPADHSDSPTQFQPPPPPIPLSIRARGVGEGVGGWVGGWGRGSESAAFARVFPGLRRGTARPVPVMCGHVYGLQGSGFSS